jgi:hypothetical protein
VYAVVDRRADGRQRIVSEHRKPLIAAVCVDILRAAGAHADVLLLSQVTR